MESVFRPLEAYENGNEISFRFPNPELSKAVR